MKAQTRLTIRDAIADALHDQWHRAEDVPMCIGLEHVRTFERAANGVLEAILPYVPDDEVMSSLASAAANTVDGSGMYIAGMFAAQARVKPVIAAAEAVVLHPLAATLTVLETELETYHG